MTECCNKTNVPILSTNIINKIECLWKSAFCDTKIISDQCQCCILTLTHSIQSILPTVKLNGLNVCSILAKNGFYSVEVSGCYWVNLYVVSIPNIPGCNGCKSSGEIYVEALIKFGISVDGNSYNWNSCPNTITIYSKAIGMSPIDFSKKQIAALKAIQEVFFSKC
jgi:hypothetical protein